MSAAITLPPDALLCHLPATFELERGGHLPGGVVAYELDGPAGALVVVVLGGISADRRPASWWRGVVGDGLAVDTRRFRVLAIDWLGGAGCSTGPGAGEPFPFVTTRDQADALALVLDQLGVECVHALVGASYGGMVGLQFAARHGERVDWLAVLAAADRSHPQASAWRWLQRGIVELGERAGERDAALALARGLAMTTYRSPGELAERFASGVEVHDWLAVRGQAFAERFLPEQFVCLNRSIDEHAVLAEKIALAAVTFVGFDSDQLVPAADVRRLAHAVPGARYEEVPTPFGHDGFLKEVDAVSAILREVLR